MNGAALGIDLGTSGCRGIAIAADGSILAHTHTELPPPLRRQAQVEQNPQLWWQAVDHIIRQILIQLGDIPLTSIAIDGTSGTLLLCDTDGQPLTPGLMYNDARATAEAERISACAPTDTAASGASSALAKLLWLQQHGPITEAHFALHQADWVANRLGGEFGLSDTNNCMKLGYDALAAEWPAWLDQLAIPRELLPRALPPGSLMGQLTPQLAAHYDIDHTVAIVAGTTDSTAAIYASGAAEPGDAITSLGSTLVTKVICETPIYDPKHGVYSQPFGRYWLVGGASNSGGNVLLNYFSREQLAQMTPLLQPGEATGLDYYPLCEPGERFPINDPDYPPRLSPRPDSDMLFFQAILEGIAEIEKQAYLLLEALGAPYPQRVYTLGGGASNAAWRQIRQHKLSVEVITATQTEAAYGSALLARLHQQQGE
ncbi:MAG: FGGY-family carbohydrate kinase [Gammaproteobacteria bacterium]|nr:FGGY-family carbohydrate kinase [Gammaproteobacteria bacterium]